MSAYLIVRVNITDWNKYKHYLNIVPAVINKFGGKYIARAGKTVTLEGPEETRRIVLIEFPAIDQAQKFYNSSEYQEVKILRTNAAIGEIIIVDDVK